ncbi:hypothetical protein BASA50_005958 [Batrachochytrium salamandrivorans]|uniref:Uncharacterized protein n=1 Tax=Batrachochytrium salamandrivorans TaxID=1357716 RepID=A0ABQ8FAY9_9FUNG|nr:hypothetical protein BASA50_005958 [Batrachochytrium salamandrivorans]
MSISNHRNTLVILHEDVLVHRPSIVSLSIVAGYDFPETLSSMVIMTNERVPALLQTKPRLASRYRGGLPPLASESTSLLPSSQTYQCSLLNRTLHHRIHFQKMDESDEDMASLFTGQVAMTPPDDMLVVLVKSKASVYFRRPESVDSVRLSFMDKGSMTLEKLANLVGLQRKPEAETKSETLTTTTIEDHHHGHPPPPTPPTPPCSPLDVSCEVQTELVVNPTTDHQHVKTCSKATHCHSKSTVDKTLSLPIRIAADCSNKSLEQHAAKESLTKDEPQLSVPNVTHLRGVYPYDLSSACSMRYSAISSDLWGDVYAPLKSEPPTPPCSPTSATPDTLDTSATSPTSESPMHTLPVPKALFSPPLHTSAKKGLLTSQWSGWESTSMFLQGIHSTVVGGLSKISQDDLLVSVVGSGAMGRAKSSRRHRCAHRGNSVQNTQKIASMRLASVTPPIVTG